MNLNFQKWITCWEDFRNFEKLFFVFPIVHQYVNLTIITYWRFEFLFEDFTSILVNFPHTWHWNIYQKWSLFYIWVIWYKKKWLFFIMFFSISPTCSYFFIQKLRQNEVIYCENDNEKFFKNWKNHEIFS